MSSSDPVPVPARFRRPTDVPLEEFKEFVRQTGCPENFAGLAQDKPDISGNHELLFRFDLGRKQRPLDDFVPCALCGPYPKFLNGWLIWSEDEKIRVIGHRCADSHFGSPLFRSMVENYDARIREAVNENYLIDRLAHVGKMLDELETLEPIASFLDEERRKFSRDFPSLMQTLRVMVRENAGSLIVEVERSKEQAVGPSGFRTSQGGASNVDVVRVASLVGHDFLGGGKTASSRIEDVRALIAGMPRCSDDTAAFYCVADMDEPTKRRLADTLRGAVRSGIAVHDRLAQEARFLTAENFGNIARWAEHSDNNWKITVRAYSKNIVLRADEERQVTLRLAPQSVPSLPTFQRLHAISSDAHSGKPVSSA